MDPAFCQPKHHAVLEGQAYDNMTENLEIEFICESRKAASIDGDTTRQHSLYS